MAWELFLLNTYYTGLIAIIELETEEANIYLLLTENKWLVKPLTFRFAFILDNETYRLHKHDALINSTDVNFNFPNMF